MTLTVNAPLYVDLLLWAVYVLLALAVALTLWSELRRYFRK